MINCSDFTDIELHGNYKTSGENSWLACLFKRYSKFVFAICMKYLKDYENSKDASMQIFENLIEGLKKHEVNNFKSWLHSVSRNHCLMHIRSKRPETSDTADIEKNVTSFMEYQSFLHQEGEKTLENKLSELEKAMLQLNEEQRLCVDLFYLQEKCYNEVAEITGFTLNQVKSYIQNGKRNLQLLMIKVNESSR